jgi:CAAX protease family protein
MGQRLPVWFRAVVQGLAVTAVPTLVWAVLVTINLGRTPRVPWAAAVMAGLLWAYWRYVRGDGPPRRLAASRRERLRAVSLTPEAWGLALLAGGAGAAAVWAAFAGLRGVLHIANQAGDVTRFPMLTVVAAILMGSAVAGVAEEAGFRGYMQRPLERAYGPGIAIAVTSVVFTLLHLTHGAAILPFLPFFLVVAVVYGLLAYLTGSILPSMTLHFAGDVMMFGLRFAEARQGITAGAATGSVLPGPLMMAAVLAGVSILAFRLLARDGRGHPPAAVPAFGS